MKLAVVAGEASGDLHASEVVHRLREIDPGLVAFGIGGERLRAEGVEILHDVRELGIVGLFNVLWHIPMFKRVFRDILERIEREKPDVVLLVDYPDFNLRLAKQCRQRGIRVVYYISPQLWAWRRGRIHDIRRDVDHMLVILPFEEEIYRAKGVPSTYVGHPLLEQLDNVKKIDRPLPGASDALCIALMPGSRRHEVDALLPPMIEAINLLSAERPVRPFIVQAVTIDDGQLASHTAKSHVPVEIRSGRDRAAIVDADICLCCSGTATLETGIIGVPLVVVYKLSPLSFVLAKRLVRLPSFSLVNIVAGKRVVPELLQGDVNGETIAAAVRALLDPETYSRTVAELATLREKLGGTGAARRAAEKIVTLVRQTSPATDHPTV